MSGLIALEKLRQRCWCREQGEATALQAWKVSELLDEAEDEIAERFMELPVDADGVPIREGDVVQFVNDAGGTGAAVEVCAISEHYVYYGEGKHFYRAVNCRHVKPRTVEDVLRELADVARLDRAHDLDDGDIEGFAAEIRELLLGDEPFCEQVDRWLHGDAPSECRECGDGRYGELTANDGEAAR